MNTNNCNRKEDLVTYLYGEMTSTEEREFRKHLGQCKSCEMEERDFKAVRMSMQSWQLGEIPRTVIELEKSALQPKLQPNRTLKQILSELAEALPVWFRYGATFATACTLALVAMAALNTQIRYDSSGFSLQFGLFQQASVAQQVDEKKLEEMARAMVDRAVVEREASLKQDIESKIATLNRELSEKNASLLSKAALELKMEQRSRLQRALDQIERRSRGGSEFEQDPFSLWGGVQLQQGYNLNN